MPGSGFASSPGSYLLLGVRNYGPSSTSQQQHGTREQISHVRTTLSMEVFKQVLPHLATGSRVRCRNSLRIVEYFQNDVGNCGQRSCSTRKSNSIRFQHMELVPVLFDEEEQWHHVIAPSASRSNGLRPQAQHSPNITWLKA